mmetsp:Transcript_4326/g.9431  ORF Transcript_4326/g.9431 Transcript_4326/m.9431 type:complete len:503 (-) Transcript_4326:97-1605(-)
MSSYGSSSATNREPGAPPVPPPKPSSAIPASSSTTTTARRTAGTRVASRPMPRSTGRYTSARATTTTAATTGASKAKPMPTKTTTTNSSSSSSRKSGDTASASGASSIRGTTPRTTSRPVVARKAPAASRPVGSYYNSAPAPSVSGAASTAGDVASNPYAAPVPSQAAPSAATAGAAIDTSDADTDTWDDWGSPDPKATTTAASTNDWYGSATTTATSAAPGYTSSGFANQQQQQQQPGTGFYQTPNMQQQQQQQQPFLSGAMDSSAPMMMSSGNSNSNGSLNSAGNSAAANPMGSFSMFMPSATTVQQQGQSQDSSYPLLDDEPPLLEELGINIEHILLKSKAVVFPFSRFGGDQIDPRVICEDSDLPGPVAILLLLGAEMVLTGKLQFGFIYIYGLLGCIAMTLVVNLVSPNDAVSFWTVTSIMGYALLPVNALALVKIFVMNLIHLQTLGNILGFFTIVWSTLASTRLLELGCGLRDQRYLIMYPLFLFYSAFVMMTIL